MAGRKTKKPSQSKTKQIRAQQERERRRRIREDPVRKEEEREKEHLRYLRKKKLGIITTISQKSKLEQRIQRKIWRQYSKEYRKRARTFEEGKQNVEHRFVSQNHTPPGSDVDDEGDELLVALKSSPKQEQHQHIVQESEEKDNVSAIRVKGIDLLCRPIKDEHEQLETEMLPQQYCLRWKYHHSNLQTMFSHLLDRGCFCDVTLACEGQLIRAHRVVLCACSTFFDQVLTNYASERDPIIIIKDVTFADVKCLIEFMYKGEINVEHASLASLLKTADDLKIKGLAEVSWRDEETDPVMMEHHPRMQENIPHNEQRSPPRNYHESRAPSSPMPPSSSSSTSRSAPRMPMLTPMPSSSGEYVGPKRKRGRPPLDDSYDVFSTPKISHVAPSCEMMYPEVRTRLDSPPPEEQHNSTPRDSEEPIQISPEPTEWSHQNVEHEVTEVNHNSTEQSGSQESNPGTSSEFYQNPDSHEQENEPGEEITVEEERKYSIDQDLSELGAVEDQDEQSNSKLDESEASLTTEELAQWDDVVKMDAYLSTGRRPQFWEEPFTKRVLDAIKNKKLEMKKAAKLLGVSYGTLYGRYREVYGCLKHPYRPSTTMMNRYDLVWPHKRSGNSLLI